jgi:hypothetical protein
MFLALLAAPLLIMLMALINGLILGLPVMIGLHFLHDFIPLVPQLGFWGSFWLVVVTSLLFGHNSNDS